MRPWLTWPALNQAFDAHGDALDLGVDLVIRAQRLQLLDEQCAQDGKEMSFTVPMLLPALHCPLR
jgi:hypothetical protein